MKTNFFSVYCLIVLVCISNIACNTLPPITEITDIPALLDIYRQLPEGEILIFGVGNLSSISASCEQAKSNALIDVCRQISKGVLLYDTLSYHPLVENLPEDWRKIHLLNLSENLLFKQLPEDWLHFDPIGFSSWFEDGYFDFLNKMYSEKAFAELSKYIVHEEWVKAPNGNILYSAYIPKTDLIKIAVIDEYIGNRLGSTLNTDTAPFDAGARMNEAFRKAFEKEKMNMNE
jgi:hypothetical protein